MLEHNSRTIAPDGSFRVVRKPKDLGRMFVPPGLPKPTFNRPDWDWAFGEEARKHFDPMLSVLSERFKGYAS